MRGAEPDPEMEVVELDPEERALLQRIREARRAGGVPSAARARVMSRLSVELLGSSAAGGPDGASPNAGVEPIARATPAPGARPSGRAHPPRAAAGALPERPVRVALPRLTDLMPRLSPWQRCRRAAGPLAAVAVSVLVVTYAVRPPSEESPKDPGSAEWLAGEREMFAEWPMFQRIVAAGSEGPFPASEELLRERPFAEGSSGWLVRSWPDLGRPPQGEAPYHFEGSALCVPLAARQRVLAAWPWVDEAASAKRPEVGNQGRQPVERSGAASPRRGRGRPPARGVELSAHARYRLSLRAWSTEPSQLRLFAAVGHAGPPYSAAGGARIGLAKQPATFDIDFTPDYDDPAAGIALLAYGRLEGGQVCLSDVQLRRLDSSPAEPARASSGGR